MQNLKKNFFSIIIFMNLSLLAADSKTESLEELCSPKCEQSKITISLVEDNIVDQKFEDPEHAAIVNAANSKLIFGAGVCGAIFKAAGIKKLMNECAQYPKGCPVGQAKTTSSCNIKTNNGAHYIIHAVGPQEVDEITLFNTYYNSLAKADKHSITAIAFPAISTGIYGYDVEDATPVALAAIMTYIKKNPTTKIRDIRLVTFKQSKKRMLNDDLEDYWIYFINLHKLVKKGIIKLSVNKKDVSPKKPVLKPEMKFEVLVTNKEINLNFITI